MIKKNKNYNGFAPERNVNGTELASNKKPVKQVITERGPYSCPTGYKR